MHKKFMPILITAAVAVVAVIFCFRLIPTSLQDTIFGGGLSTNS